MNKESDLTFVFQNPNTEQMTRQALGKWVAQVCLPVMEERIMALTTTQSHAESNAEDSKDNRREGSEEKDRGEDRSTGRYTYTGRNR